VTPLRSRRIQRELQSGAGRCGPWSTACSSGEMATPPALGFVRALHEVHRLTTLKDHLVDAAAVQDLVERELAGEGRSEAEAAGHRFVVGEHVEQESSRQPVAGAGNGLVGEELRARGVGCSSPCHAASRMGCRDPRTAPPGTVVSRRRAWLSARPRTDSWRDSIRTMTSPTSSRTSGRAFWKRPQLRANALARVLRQSANVVVEARGRRESIASGTPCAAKNPRAARAPRSHARSCSPRPFEDDPTGIRLRGEIHRGADGRRSGACGRQVSAARALSQEVPAQRPPEDRDPRATGPRDPACGASPTRPSMTKDGSDDGV
jgi:hypothetical protein